MNEASENHQESLQDLHHAVAYSAGKHKGYSVGHADYHALPAHEKLEHFNKHIVPIWEKHGRTTPGKHGPVVAEVDKNWNDAKHPMTKDVEARRNKSK